jgi:regulatory protein
VVDPARQRPDGVPDGPGDATASPAQVAADALAVGYRHIARREHSVAELRTRLHRADYPPAAVEETIATLCAQGVLDDERYARLLVEDRRALDGWGVERIRARLEAAGIDAAQIDAALESFDSAAELAAATALARRRHPEPLSTDAERQRVFAMLVRRGYDSEIAYAAVRAAGRAQR